MHEKLSDQTPYTFTIMFQQWVNFILGLWILASAYFGFSPTGFMTNMTICGILVAIFALWGALDYRHRQTPEYRQSHKMVP